MVELIQSEKQMEKDWRLLEFFVPIEEKLIENEDFIIRGVAINETTTLNNVKYVAEELEKAAPTFRKVPILLDHKNEVKSIVGRMTENVVYNPTMRRIEFEGKIMDKDIRERIKDERIGSVSIGAKVQDLKEEKDGSMKAIGIRGLEISLVAVPGDSHANLAQALQNSFYLKEKAKLSEDTKLNNGEVQMTEEKIPEETLEEKKEGTPEEKSEEAKEKINLQEQINELKSLITTSFSEMKNIQKKVKEQEVPEEEVKVDKTKGEVSEEKEKVTENLSNFIVEKSKLGYAAYRDYTKEGADTKLKRLVR